MNEVLFTGLTRAELENLIKELCLKASTSGRLRYSMKIIIRTGGRLRYRSVVMPEKVKYE